MLNILKTNTQALAIALGFTLATTFSLPLNAQTNTSDYRFLENIETEEELNWSFSSEGESISVQDEIEELGEYNISEPDSDSDAELVEEDKTWGNRGDVKDHSIELEVYEH